MGRPGIDPTAQRSPRLSHLEGTLVHDTPPMIDDPAGKPAAPAADDFVRMLRNPATIRQVILMREVLDRPVDRW